MVGMRLTGQSALVVVDIQNAKIADAWDRDGVVARIAALVARARGEGVPVVFVRHEEPGSPHLERGAWGWRFDDRVVPLPGERVISRQYPDAFANTMLADSLDAMDVTHVVIAGARTDRCVQATVYRAIAEGWHVTLAADCHTTSRVSGGTPAELVVSHANAVLASLEYPGRVVEVVPHDEVCFSVAVMQGAA
jgi:nicotinamidase-related amidase